MEKLSRYCDYTILKPDANKADVEKIVKEAIENDCASVCVNQYRTKMVAELLKDTSVLTCTVVGFPLGAVDTGVKVYETTLAVSSGADEIDMVINIGALKDKNYEYVREDIESVKRACKGKLLKVIIETCLLTEEEIVKACELVALAGADYVKTSTGFSTGGAKVKDVELMKKNIPETMKLKASGGIRDKETALAMIEAGADRIGTSTLLY